ncbi:hypothetical protein [Chryseobacterium nepalense]|jgi:hypothetical protein|uniref:YcxB family protein n=1 Tax=Chryseobacterium nepalense TaxID=1854498 RepID=A0ABY4K074_9FLAO|nr:hypothetical protein [Chryseobacterium nepalense]MEC5173280.1 hypothetical protein [Chryseobacterium nepalense]UPQ74199.1 hypothetical protein M0D58_09045 [Chryseobacterium nepalense]
MEMPLKAFINFNEKTTRKQLDKYFYYSWKKKLPYLFKNFVFATVFLLIIDGVFKIGRSKIDLKFIAYFFAAYILLYIIIFFYNKINYNSKINQHIAELKKFDPTIEFVLDEQSFYIKCEQFDIRSVWKKVTYSISGKTLLIFIDLGTPFTFLLNEEETEQYPAILDIFKMKSKLKK